MHDWNVVVTIHEGHFPRALRFLSTLGLVSKTDYFNVVVMNVADTTRFLSHLDCEIKAAPEMEGVISRVVPAAVTFDFRTPAEFEEQAMRAVHPWVSQLAGSSFHVRMHRRGFKARMSSQDEEQFLDRFLMEKLRELEGRGRIDFADPDIIIDVETVGQRAALSMWTREQRSCYPFLKLD